MCDTYDLLISAAILNVAAMVLQMRIAVIAGLTAAIVNEFCMTKILTAINVGDYLLNQVRILNMAKYENLDRNKPRKFSNLTFEIRT